MNIESKLTKQLCQLINLTSIKEFFARILYLSTFDQYFDYDYDYCFQNPMYKRIMINT